ncbi:hypothetical protein [[Mycoplasma] mobile]|uniref:TM2 domain-containing protein n=1 Tax=Mycoplasma mobile (strain ATCC 43663 / 163K / NCTC 11711) TaxID=267748 RepID=Q6KHQ9_MYCM1|nr:hypothetical protein [[Mycoplasma] mobile]AAT27869.1 hypothetical protein MMOB3830 [Mycoplasma mobile 163K]
MNKSSLKKTFLIMFTIFFGFLGFDKWYLGFKKMALIKGLFLSVFGVFGIFFLIIFSSVNFGAININLLSFPIGLTILGSIIIAIYFLTIMWYLYDILRAFLGKTKDKNKLNVSN